MRDDMPIKGKGHLYRFGAKAGQLRKFENRYGIDKGKKVYGAVIGKVKRERAARLKA